MFKRFIVLTAIMLSSSNENMFPKSHVIEITGEELTLAALPINAIMASRVVYSSLDMKNELYFNTSIRNYNLEKGHLESKVDDTIISIPKGEDYSLQQKQMDLFVKLGFFTHYKNYLYVGKNNLKGFYSTPIKVTSNNIIIEETKKGAGNQYKITKKGTEHLAKKNKEILVNLGYLKADILSLTKNTANDFYTATYKLQLDNTPAWLTYEEALLLFPSVISEIEKIKRSVNVYTINLTNENSTFTIIKGTNQ